MGPLKTSTNGSLINEKIVLQLRLTDYTLELIFGYLYHFINFGTLNFLIIRRVKYHYSGFFDDFCRSTGNWQSVRSFNQF